MKNMVNKVKIGEIDSSSMDKAQKKWNSISKPIDSLGKFEEIIIQIAGITKNYNIDIHKRAVIAICADNGIVEEGVTQTDNSVTAIVAKNMAKGLANVCSMAKVAHADVIPVDIGIASDIAEDGLVVKKVAYGTKNFLKEPAMTYDEVIQAINIGIDMVKTCKDKGYTLLATGEMGIGNTSTSSAIASVLLDIPVEKVTSRGAGLDDIGLERKINVIKQAIEFHKIDKNDTLKVLQTFGGLDIAGLVGVYIGGAMYKVPIIIDGIIAMVAALVAVRLENKVRNYMIPSHSSKEIATELIMQELELEPIINANLALGEGTGAVMLIPMLDMVLEIYQKNVTFEECDIEPYQKYN